MDKHIKTQNIYDTLETNYMPYAMSVIISRALPEIDGLKPSHRKILYTMYKMGLLKGGRTKSANIVGQTMKLHPHGDLAIYETMVRMTRGNDALLHPFVDSKGNMGKAYSKDMAFAAARYTEAKLASICEEMFRDIDKDTVDFTDNYDGTMKEPVLLPSAFPNILINASQGIAVGMASKFCSFNLKEVCKTTIEYIKDPNVKISKYLKAPDFSTGGNLLYDKKQLERIYKKGKGSFKVRAKYKINKKKSIIEIVEIPYTTSVEAIIDSIAKLVKSNKIKEITDIRDETDLNGLKITIDAKKNTDYDLLIKKLLRFTPLQDSFSCNFTMLIGNNPRLMSIKGIIEEWTLYRIKCIKRQLSYDCNKMKEKLHLLKGLQKILLDIDKAIAIIRNTEKQKDVIPNLMKGFEIDKIQAEYIAEIKLRNLNKEYIINRTNEIEQLTSSIKDLEETLKSEKKIKDIIVKQLKQIMKKYGRERRTGIIKKKEQKKITKEVLIEDYNLKLFLTKEGYLKKIPLVSLRSRPSQKLKENDKVIQTIEASNKMEVLLFSNQCQVYKRRLFDIKDNKASQWGSFLPNFLDMDDGEEIVYIAVTEDYSGFMVFAYENGKVSKVNMQAYYTKTNRKMLANAYYANSPVVKMVHLHKDKEFVVFSDIDKVVFFDTSDIKLKSSRQIMGNKVIRLKKDSKVIRMDSVKQSGIKNCDYYRTKSIPAVGRYLKDEDYKDNQNTII